MRTRSQTRNRNRNRQQQAPPAVVEPFNLEEPFDNPPLVPMADNQTMAELLQAPTEGYEDAIVIPEINANFELKHGLINLVQNKQFQQRFDESFYEAWDRFNDLLRACPHHRFSEYNQLDTFYNALNANDQDSLNSAAVVAKVSLSSSTPGISPNVAALTTEVSELKNTMKTMLIDKQKAQVLVPVKAVEQSCITCGGAHSYRNCLATDGNVYRDNIQEYVSQAAAANFNQGNTNSRPLMETISTKIGEPFVIQNRGNNFNQRQIYQPSTSQPPVYQAHPYQAPAPQMQGVSKTDFENYVKANDAVLRNMQNQGQGSLPSNTITNPKEDLKGITTRSRVVYQGPTIPTSSSPKVVERRTKVTKDTVFPTNNENTKDVHPPVVRVANQILVSEPVVAPVSAPMPNPKPSIPYPSRRNDEKRRENANEQI
ncbi:hypothetical protein Tco_0707407 [Tanacetum coccineum]|uniref:Retrotransposon gag domain-containing protein n=1 Tax=Tanacetum coccineum TaxID=301880 RepID=A0ABQ4YBP4_9ASTR